MPGREILAAAIVAFTLSATANAQFIHTSILGEQFVKNERYKGVKTFSVSFIGAWQHPDRESLERKAKEEARRLLAGIAYKGALPEGKELDRAFVEGSHMMVIVDVKLAWDKDASRVHSGASVETVFIVSKKGETTDPRIGKGLPNLERCEAHSVVACHRDEIVTSIERAMQKNIEELSNGFFESR
jgi:hypothetical protein